MKIYIVVSDRGCYTDYYQTNELATTSKEDADSLLKELATQIEKDEFLNSAFIEVWENGKKL